ncbi:MAG: flagellar biosynthesis protein FlhA [Planctomycetota bacterium]
MNTISEKTENLGFAQQSETWLSATFLITLGVLIVPLPTFLLDMFLATNLAIAILLLLVTLNAKRPLDVSVFPSLLLLMTLFRLSLNVATTRLILLDGNAGSIVDAFGSLVAGGNLIVGCVVFLILVTIQFIVITKGATRISEVNARFALDSMPGKQMAIDAELNVGAIDEAEAKVRRAELAAESEFYGAMDGASKYVRGDAIAGLIIMAVNILGGVILAVSNGQELVDAIQIYSLLTIGDGLVSQIPALIIASSAGVLVTKSTSDSNLGQEIGKQVSAGHRSLVTGAIVLGCVALVPGFPKLPFLGLSALLVLFTRIARQSIKSDAEEEAKAEETEEVEASPEEVNLDNFLQQDRIVIEIGAGLIGLFDPKDGKGIVGRVASLRKDLGAQFGIWIPKIRIQDNLKIDVLAYRIKICGRAVGNSEIRPKEFLAINPGSVNTPLEGTETIDPAFGLKAKWINESLRRRAEIAGFTVVDATTVLTTHLGECLKSFAHELLSREDLQRMLDKLKETSPTIVGEVRPDGLNAGTLHQVLIRLLMESVPIANLERIIESCSHHFAQTKHTTALTEFVRADIGANIVESFRVASSGRVAVVLLEPKLEQVLREKLDGDSMVLGPKPLTDLIDKIKANWELGSMKNETPAVLVDGSVRWPLKKTIRRSLPQVAVVSYNEVPDNLQIEPIAVIRHDEIFGGSTDALPLGNGQTTQNQPDPNPQRTVA